MKRAILLLATAALGMTGCYSRRDPGTMTFYWNFRNAQGVVTGDFTQSTTGCDVAGVDSIDVIIDNGTFQATCVGPNGVPGVQLQQFLPGAYPFTVQGRRGGAQGEVVFTVSGTANADYNVDSQVTVTLDALSPQSFVLFYDVNLIAPTNCVFNGQPAAGIVYRLEDPTGTSVISTTEVLLPNGTTGQQPVACDPVSLGLSIPNVPLGAYRLRYFQAINAAGVSIAQTCLTPVSHTGFPAIVNLTAPVPGTVCGL
jgi:hypothetical protein